MSKLVLVNTMPGTHPLLGLGYLASYLEKYLGFDEVELVEGDGHKDGHIKERVLGAKPSLIGYTSFTMNFPGVNQLAREIKQETGLPQLIGGPHVTAMPQELPGHFDVGVVGEGEETTIELMRVFLETGGLEPGKIKDIDGVIYHEDGGTVATRPRGFLKSLDDIPYPKRSIFDMEKYLRPQNLVHSGEWLRGTSMITSRGCPYQCVFCHVAEHWRYSRLHSAEHVANEIEMLYRQYGVEAITIMDDMFLVRRDRVREIADLLEAKGVLGRVRFHINGRANLINEETLSLLRRMNVVDIGLGVESGSERVLSYLKDGKVTVEQNRSAIRLAKEAGIHTLAFIMIGTPTETKEEMLETLQFLKDTDPASIGVGVTTPYPGTGLWDYAEQIGAVTKDMDWSLLDPSAAFEGRKGVYINEAVSPEEFSRVVAQFRRFLFRHFLRHRVKNLSLGQVLKYLRRPDKVIRVVRAMFGGTG